LLTSSSDEGDVDGAPIARWQGGKGGASCAQGKPSSASVANKELVMNRKWVTIPELALIAGTRVALGAGMGLLLGDRLSDEQRRAVGWTLLAVGAITTVPLAAEVLFAHGQDEPDEPDQWRASQQRDREIPALSP
jgi:hypothetical protein